MSYDLIETSVDDGEPIELYRFTTGTGAATNYCDSDLSPTFQSEQYNPVFIERETIQTSDTLDGAELEVRVAADSSISELFGVYPPGQIVGLTIFRCHWDESTGAITTPVAIWIGRVLSRALDGDTAKLLCEPAVTSLRRVGLRRHYQTMCPHVLYGGACGANEAAHTIAAGATAVDTRAVTVGATLNDAYRGGVVTWRPETEPAQKRTVVRVISNPDGSTTLVLAGSTGNLMPGMLVDIARGCRHTLGDCRDVFDNAPNFGGQPYIPTKNPHGTTTLYN